MTVHGNRMIGTIAEMGGVTSIPTPFHRSLLQMVQYNAQYLVNPGEQVFYDMATASYHSFARNSLADRMQGDWLLMLDTDHQFAPDLAARLLRVFYKHDLDVLSAMYVYLNPPHNPVMFIRMPDGRLQFLGDWERRADLEVMEVGAAGGGCLLVHRRVFDRIRDELHENPFSTLGDMSEDLSFFDRLQRLGIPAYVALGIESLHLTWRPVGLADYTPGTIPLDPDRVLRDGRT